MAQHVLMCSNVCKQFLLYVKNSKPYNGRTEQDNANIFIQQSNFDQVLIPLQLYVCKNNKQPQQKECVSPSISNNVEGMDLKLHTHT